MVSAVEINHPNTTQATMTQPSSNMNIMIMYTSLIQTYLNLLCYDNASFLAERYVAESNNDAHAVYLLAYCYFRRGDVRAARSVLIGRRWNDDDGVITANNTTAADGESEEQKVRNSARYLLATCCYQLGLYGEAEEALLRFARERFGREVIMGTNNGGSGSGKGKKIRGNVNEVMDAWIVKTDPCPIPNGPAGLHLLGNICRKSNRRQRAIEYYRLSLKLDPLMWTSYEAICELGGPIGNSDEADDPHSIFGVDPPSLSPRHTVNMEGGVDYPADKYRNMSFKLFGNNSSNNNNTNVSAADNASVVGHHQESGGNSSFALNRYYGTPSTPYSTFDKMSIGVNNHNQPTSVKRGDNRESDIHNHLNRPATGSTIAPRSRTNDNSNASALPQTNLFNVTPAVGGGGHEGQESIMETPAGAVAATTPGGSKVPTSAISYADQVLTQARRVAAGQYYEPSPETTPSRRHGGGKNIFDSRFNDVSAIPNSATAIGNRNAQLSFSTTLPSTPNVNVAPMSPFHAGLSSVKGEKRALSPSMALESTRKKPGQEKLECGVPDLAEGNEYELDSETERDCVGRVLKMLSTFGAAYKYLCQYRSNDALEIFRELPRAQINTGWVQHQIGKAYFEMSDYQNAETALVKMQQLEPHRMKGLDVLSTTLWHLKKEVELSDLAQRAVDFDRMAPQAWFVVGNCFSFQKEHDTAITFFHRSIQLDPTYTYAHTLCGHEYMSNEDFDKAISCYRDAIRVDARHYNAWYGLGAIYFRQEKFDLAEYHFQRALEINPQSSVLHCHLGMAQHHNGKTFDALETLAGAFLLDSRNPQAHYQRATIFMSLDRPQEALLELEKVRSAAPREASVHFNMGKVLKRLGQPAKAMRCFLTALDLDPKDNNLIKAAMDRLDEDDVEEEVSVF